MLSMEHLMICSITMLFHLLHLCVLLLLTSHQSDNKTSLHVKPSSRQHIALIQILSCLVIPTWKDPAT